MLAAPLALGVLFGVFAIRQQPTLGAAIIAIAWGRSAFRTHYFLFPQLARYDKNRGS